MLIFQYGLLYIFIKQKIMITNCPFDEVLDGIRQSKRLLSDNTKTFPVFRNEKNKIWVWVNPSNNTPYVVTPIDGQPGCFAAMNPKLEVGFSIEDMLDRCWTICYGEIK